MKNILAKNYLWLSLLLSSVLPILLGLTLSNLYPDWRWSHYPFHSMVESIGSLSALTIATLIIIMVNNNNLSRIYILIACALISMGLLDGFHAALHVGVSFVWLHSIATMVGGLIFSAVWLPQSLHTKKRQHYLLFITIIASLSIGIISAAIPEMLPTMAVDGQFTFVAKAINFIGGIGFLIGTSYFIHDYYKQGRGNVNTQRKHHGGIVFANQCLLFGIAALLFETSMLWDTGWWWWHILRLLAYIVVLIYFFALFSDEQTRLKYNKDELEELNNTLESRVETRTIELEEEKQLLDNILGNAAAIIIILDDKGRILRFNYAAEQITGYSLNELYKQPIWEWLVPPEQFEGVKQVFDNLTRERLDSNYENHLMKKDGGRVLITWNNSTIANKIGEIQYVISVGIDISEREATQKVLEEAKHSADKANKAKSEFLSSMSHELRTPMNSILGFGQLLELDKDILSENQNSAVQDILAGGNHLLHLINEVLDLATIESGNIDCDIKETALKQIVDECSSLMDKLAEKSNIQIDYGNPQKYIIMADPQRFKQVLLNFLSNAIKYNRPNGQVTINYHPVENNCLRINVTDTGEGISESDLAMLFQPFTRVGNKSTNIEGTGIGLVISKELMTLMNGAVGISSTVGEGSTFWLEIKLAE